MNLPETNRGEKEIGHLLERVLKITESMLASLESSDWLKVTDLTEERAKVIKELEAAMRTRLSGGHAHGPIAQTDHALLVQRIRERGERLSARLESRRSELLHAMEAENNGAVHRAYAQQENS